MRKGQIFRIRLKALVIHQFPTLVANIHMLQRNIACLDLGESFSGKSIFVVISACCRMAVCGLLGGYTMELS